MNKSRLALVVVAIVAMPLVARVAWIQFEWPVRMAWAKVSSASGPVRWWRCKDVSRPLLRESTGPWTLRYSWVGPEGPGAMSLKVTNDGRGVFRSRTYTETKDTVLMGTIPSTEITALTNVVDESGIFCQTSERHPGYIVWDLGRFTIEVSAPDYKTTVFIDECHDIPDGWAMSEVVAQLMTMKEHFGEQKDYFAERLAWGPYGTSTVGGDVFCQPEPANQSLHRSPDAFVTALAIATAAPAAGAGELGR